MKKLSINVDMGAKNNGVFLASIDIEKNEIKKSAFNVSFDENSKNKNSKNDGLKFNKTDRRAKRHDSRSNDRDRFVLRFIKQIFDFEKLPTKKMLLEKINDEKIEYIKKLQEPKELIFGLFKDRGFTHQNIDISDESFDDENFISLLEKFNFSKEYGYEFIECKNLNDFENIINQKADEFSNYDSFKDNMLDFLNKQQKIINDIKDIYDISVTINTKEKEIKKEIKKPNKSNEKLKELQKELIDLKDKQEELTKNYQNFVKSSNFKEISKLKDRKNFFEFFNNLINSIKNEIERNNKHRKVYLKILKKKLKIAIIKFWLGNMMKFLIIYAIKLRGKHGVKMSFINLSAM